MSKIFRKMSSRIFWGMNVDKTDCPLTKTLIKDYCSAILINSSFILFSENCLKLLHFLRLRNRRWRNRTWCHRSSGSPNGQFRAWSIWYWKPFGFRWSTIKAMGKLEWYDFGLEKSQKLKKWSKNSIRHPCLKSQRTTVYRVWTTLFIYPQNNYLNILFSRSGRIRRNPT